MVEVIEDQFLDLDEKMIHYKTIVVPEEVARHDVAVLGDEHRFVLNEGATGSECLHGRISGAV